MSEQWILKWHDSVDGRHYYTGERQGPVVSLWAPKQSDAMRFGSKEDAIAAQAVGCWQGYSRPVRLTPKAGTSQWLPPVTVCAEDTGEIWIAKAIALAGLAKSSSEAMRFIKTGAVRNVGVVINDERRSLYAPNAYDLTVGLKNRRHVRLTVAFPEVKASSAPRVKPPVEVFIGWGDFADPVIVSYSLTSLTNNPANPRVRYVLPSYQGTQVRPPETTFGMGGFYAVDAGAILTPVCIGDTEKMFLASAQSAFRGCMRPHTKPSGLVDHSRKAPRSDP